MASTERDMQSERAAPGAAAARAKKTTRQWLAAPKRRQQLLACAVQVAANRGLGRAGHTEIAHAAGVAVSSVFAYFPTRRALLAAIVEEVGRFYLELAHRYHETDLTPLEAVHRHFYGFADSVSSDPAYAQVWLEWAVSTRNEDGLWDSFLRFQERMIHIIATSIRRCQAMGTVPRSVPAADAARLLVASAYTTTQLKFMKRSKAMIHRYTDQALRLALQH
jgi:TetR/AcrR family hemagglutinin/protease transcriptional regulator